MKRRTRTPEEIAMDTLQAWGGIAMVLLALMLIVVAWFNGHAWGRDAEAADVKERIYEARMETGAAVWAKAVEIYATQAAKAEAELAAKNKERNARLPLPLRRLEVSD